MAAASPLPSHVGRYRVERELGRGAMGVVYQAHDPIIGRPVAIKLVRADLLDGEERTEFLDRFRREAQAAGRCMHPNVVGIYDFAMHEGNPFLAMEYVEGAGLGQTLRSNGRFEPGAAVAIVVQVLAALGAAHRLGIVHRDVKPPNILVLPDGHVKVTDFGISRVDTSELTLDGRVIGTPAYMSPEQCRGESVDARSDLFSTGTVLYELLSGARPFPGRNVTEVTHRLLTTEPKDLGELVAGLPESLIAVLRRAMTKDREARFSSAQEMIDALRNAMREVGTTGAASEQGDRTRVMSSRPAIVAPSRAAFDDLALTRIERRLAQDLGPMAGRMVRDAARQSTSVEGLCEVLASGIGRAAARERFLVDVLGDARSGLTGIAPRLPVPPPASKASPPATSANPATLSNPTTLSSMEIERVERALAQQMGPIAKLLVKRALPSIQSEAELWERLSRHIDNPADRLAFLRQRPRAR
jgi:predicted Ser/Thr protein kinase